jgi:TPR repeat protein
MKRTIILSVVILFALLSPGLAKAQMAKWAGEKYETFLTCLLKENNYECAKAELEKLSEQGDAQASCCLGAMLCFGEKNDRDYTKALELLKESALKNYERAEYLLGAFGSMERSRDFLKAITGDDSMSDTADDNFWKQCFKHSNSEIVTFKDAFYWFLMKDGDWGYRDIMYYSAVQYLNGSYGVIDANKAIKWLNRSKNLGSPEAERLLEQIKEEVRKRSSN